MKGTLEIKLMIEKFNYYVFFFRFACSRLTISSNLFLIRSDLATAELSSWVTSRLRLELLLPKPSLLSLISTLTLNKWEKITLHTLM